MGDEEEGGGGGKRDVSPLGAVKTAAGEGKTHICATTGWECKCLYGEITGARGGIYAGFQKCHI